MEDVKEQIFRVRKININLGFNPCFNGRCKRTRCRCIDIQDFLPGFNPCFNGRCKRTVENEHLIIKVATSFNPCFNGRCKRTSLSWESSSQSTKFQSLF